MIIIFFSGGSWAYFYQNVLKDDIPRLVLKTNYQISGELTSAPDIRERDQRFYVSGTLKNPLLNTTFLVILPKEETFLWGDTITLQGKLTRPRNFDGFDYRGYLQRFGVRYSL